MAAPSTGGEAGAAASHHRTSPRGRASSASMSPPSSLSLSASPKCRGGAGVRRPLKAAEVALLPPFVPSSQIHPEQGVTVAEATLPPSPLPDLAGGGRATVELAPATAADTGAEGIGGNGIGSN
uniref:Uncharacterized protein n=1 Tax=Oryza meridionalis TaxID=40149 RepID=A0A0E0CMB2_9ORYZ